LAGRTIPATALPLIPEQDLTVVGLLAGESTLVNEVVMAPA